MEFETVTEIPKEKKQRKFFVYYNDADGRIVKISKKLIPETANPYVITENAVCSKIISGKENSAWWCVHYDDETNEPAFMHKKDVAGLRAPENLLYKIPKNRVSNDINIKLYPQDNIVTVNVSYQTKQKLLWGIKMNDLTNPQGSKMNLYITKRNNPDFLINQIIIDPLELVRENTVAVRLKHSIERYVDISDIDIYTMRLFDSYGYDIGNEYVPTYNTNQRRINISKLEEINHIVVTRRNNGTFYIRGTQDLYKTLPNKRLHLFFVDATIEDNIDQRFIGSLDINSRDLSGKTVQYRSLHLPEKYKVVHQYPNLVIGETHEHDINQ